MISGVFRERDLIALRLEDVPQVPVWLRKSFEPAHLQDRLCAKLAEMTGVSLF